MGASIHYLGGVSSGATTKLAINTLFAVQVVTVAEWVGLFAREGVDLGRAVETFGALPVTSPAVKAALAAMVAEQFAPQFPIELVAKDLGYAATLGQARSAELPMTHAARELFAAANARGHAGENITAIVRRYR
jgi:3-hydroxyisobutyrate dehydrogenase